jgi:hypothetical protein
MMDAVDAATRAELIAAGELREKYVTSVDRESAHEILTGKLAGAAEAADAPPLPPPPPAREGTTRPEGRVGASTKSKGRPKPRPKGKAPEKSMGDQAKDIGIGLAKDLFTTADGRRTLRTVFGTLLGKK